MSDIKNINEHAGWYASYSGDQGAALILAQQLKIKQLTELIDKIKMDLELTDEPRVESDELVLSSIKKLVENIPEIEYTKGYFKWIG